jgi:hypothetical protein
MMEIKKVYTTSKGRFWNLAEAEKKTNRAKEYGSRPGDPVEYEPIFESFVLVLTGSYNRFEIEPMLFYFLFVFMQKVYKHFLHLFLLLLLNVCPFICKPVVT